MTATLLQASTTTTTTTTTAPPVATPTGGKTDGNGTTTPGAGGNGTTPTPTPTPPPVATPTQTPPPVATPTGGKTDGNGTTPGAGGNGTTPTQPPVATATQTPPPVECVSPLDVLVILDRSRSVVGTANHWERSLNLFQDLVDAAPGVSQHGTRFALASFSEDYRLHLGFGRLDTAKDIRAFADYGPDWKVGGKHLEYSVKQTDFSMITAAIGEAFSNPAHGSRENASSLVFVVSDGIMSNVGRSVYAKHGCPEAGKKYKCGSDRKKWNKPMCGTCWRNKLADDMAVIDADPSAFVDWGSIHALAIPDSAEGEETLTVLTNNDKARVVMTPDYDKLNKLIDHAAKDFAVACKKSITVLGKCHGGPAAPAGPPGPKPGDTVPSERRPRRGHRSPCMGRSRGP